jgi:protein ImuB
MSDDRRCLAVVLPELLTEWARLEAGGGSSLGAKSVAEGRPLGVVLGEGREAIQLGAPLAALDRLGRSLGLRSGQTIAEARAQVATLEVRVLSPSRLALLLSNLAELLLSFGPGVGFEAPDTLWVDLTGSSHLFGGEEAVLPLVRQRFTELGHRARLVIAPGPRLAQAVARWDNLGKDQGAVVTSAQADKLMATLPLFALPLKPAQRTWLVRLGVLTVGQLLTLPRASLAERLGGNAAEVLSLAAGQDPMPFARMLVPEKLEEEACWDEPCVGTQPLLFALRGVVARIASRLIARGLVAHCLELTLQQSPAWARHQRLVGSQRLCCQLAAPLCHEEELLSVLRAKLESTQLDAPCLGLRLQITESGHAFGQQLELSRQLCTTGAYLDAEALLPVLVGELEAELGTDRVGRLRLSDSHFLEKQCALVPLSAPTASVNGLSSAAHGEQANGVVQTAGKSKSRLGAGARGVSSANAHTQLRGTTRRTAPSVSWREPMPPTRLLPRPLRQRVQFVPGEVFCIGQQLYSIVDVRLVRRLESMHWWGGASQGRDYLRLTLTCASSPPCELEALGFVDHLTGNRFLCGFMD